MMSKFWKAHAEGSDDCLSSKDDEAYATNSEQGEELGVSENESLQSAAADKLSCQVENTWELLRPTQIDLDPNRSDVTASSGSRAEDKRTGKSGYTRLVCMSDTHGQHRDVYLPRGDVLIHGGDFTKSGEVGTIKDLSRYFHESGFREIVCIAGNHDITLDATYYQRNWQRYHTEPFDTQIARASLKHCIYLQDDACTVAQGRVRLYGSPWSPEFYDWAFNLPRGKTLRGVWSRIAGDTDVLITHGPPLGRCDLSTQGIRTGCYDLLQEVQQRVKPRVHVFGHIHESCGVSFDGQTLFVNASNLNLRYEPVNPCVVVDLPYDEHQPARLVVPHCTLSGLDFVRWCKANAYTLLAQRLETIPSQTLPSGNDLLKSDAFQPLFDKLQLHRDEQARLELRRALLQLIAESY
jgi:Icc-related predicted phosphoesterase